MQMVKDKKVKPILSGEKEFWEAFKCLHYDKWYEVRHFFPFLEIDETMCFKRLCIHTHIHVYILLFIRTCVLVLTAGLGVMFCRLPLAHTCARTNTNAPTCVCILMHTYIHAYTHINTYIYTYIYAYICSCALTDTTGLRLVFSRFPLARTHLLSNMQTFFHTYIHMYNIHKSTNQSVIHTHITTYMHITGAAVYCWSMHIYIHI